LSYSGELLYLKSRIEKNIDIDDVSAINEKKAEDISKGYILAKPDLATILCKNLVILKKDSTILCWRFIIESQRPDGEFYEIFINAQTGDVVSNRKLTSNYTTISGTIRIPIWNSIPTGVPYDTDVYSENETVIIKVDDNYQHNVNVTTNPSGYFTQNVDTYDHSVLYFHGPHASVIPMTGEQYRAIYSTTETSIIYTWPYNDGHDYECALFYRINQAWKEFETIVGFSSNYYHDSDFIQGKTGAVSSTGMAGVINLQDIHAYIDATYHEYTHNIVQGRNDQEGQFLYSVAPSEAKGMSEGFADFFACSFTNDSELTGTSRDLLYPPTVYYEQYDYSTDTQGYIGGGLIGSGCWNFRSYTSDTIAEKLVYNAMAALNQDEQFCDFIDELIYYDDDNTIGGGDNDPSNGTPHLASICSAFNTNHHLNGREYKIGSVYKSETWEDGVCIMNDLTIEDGVTVTIAAGATINVLA